jgi:hypothetical protein
MAQFSAQDHIVSETNHWARLECTVQYGVMEDGNAFFGLPVRCVINVFGRTDWVQVCLVHPFIPREQVHHGVQARI